ncbi:hypothetical protein HDU76_010335, partial [Blyttiomyces sp. JEL0837]
MQPYQQVAPSRVSTQKPSTLFPESQVNTTATIGSSRRFHESRNSDEKIKLAKFASMNRSQIGSHLNFGEGLPDVARLDYGNVRSWSLEDVLVWLNGLGYVEQNLMQRFRENQVTGAFLCRLSTNSVLANDILRSEFLIASTDLRLRLIEDIRSLCGTTDNGVVDSELGMNSGIGTLQPPPYGQAMISFVETSAVTNRYHFLIHGTKYNKNAFTPNELSQIIYQICGTANDILRSEFGIASIDLRLRLIEDIGQLCGTGDGAVG